MDFLPFAKIVNHSFQTIVSETNVFEVDLDGNELFAKYLEAFPAGTNPMFKVRTEHDCSCCKHFIRRAGCVVAVKGNRLVTVWDAAATTAPYPYNEIAGKLAAIVREAPIKDLYRVGKTEGSFGAAQTVSEGPDKNVLTWQHFYTGEIPANLRSDTADTIKGAYRTAGQVFQRGLMELKPDAVETVLSLIAANNLYRGEEHKPALVAFQKSQNEYLASKDRQLFVWLNAKSPAAQIRGTAIGTLLINLSEGMDVDAAVRSFESIVAPQNYKRTSAVITPMMIKKAMATIEELGLDSALERRFARLSDISVNDVKWVDTAVKPLMKGGLTEKLMQHAVKTVEVDETRAEVITLDAFMTTILPTATSMELLFKNQHLGNLVSLTAPIHPEPKQLFRWNNDFAWSYCGGVADSIKERVKKAGGKVDGANLRVSLSWTNFDDLDLHVHDPIKHGVSDHIYFGNKYGINGTLDVDMNAGGPKSREPVENVVWTKRLVDGKYKIEVNNYNRRENQDVGFVIEVEHGGKLSHFSYNKMVNPGSYIHVCTLHVKNELIERVEVGDDGISTSDVSTDRWGLKTGQFAKVNAVTLSPNYWGDNACGNRHTFFLLEGATNDEPTRGIYNEFLNPRLEPHRKVFEVIGEKTKCQPTEGQLSGLGFSSTKRDAVIVKVSQGKKQRLFNVSI